VRTKNDRKIFIDQTPEIWPSTCGASTLSDNSPAKKQISIPEDLYEDIRKSIEGKGFSTVDDYVTYVFRIAMGKKSSDVQDTDNDKVMEQLKALGYI